MKIRFTTCTVAAALVIFAPGCESPSTISTTTPAPTASPSPPSVPGTSIVVTGQVTDSATSSPIAGATVRISGFDKTTTDSSGNYSVTGSLYHGHNLDFTSVSADHYTPDFRYIPGTTQNVQLHRIERITAGDSWEVTVRPDDTLCVNNIQENPGGWEREKYVCRSVHVVAPSDGVMTLEAIVTQGGARPPLEVETRGVLPCCSERMGNPTSIQVTAGTEVVASVEMVLGSTTSQSFTLNTSMARQ